MTGSRPAMARRSPARVWRSRMEALLPDPMETLMTDSNKKSEPTPPDAELHPAPLAYLNPDFLNSPDGRILRILSEYAEPLSRFRRAKIQDTVVFFGSARFAGLDEAQKKLTILERPGAAAPAAPHNQPGGQDADA